MKLNLLDGDRAANYYDSLPEKDREGILSLDEALKTPRKTGLKRLETISDAFNLGRHDRLNGMDYNNFFENWELRDAYKKGFNSPKEY